MNMNTGKFYRNRDVETIYKRIRKDRMSFKNLLDTICEK
jgi:hypothetical protein